jgi:hypothetical protein
MPSEVKKVNDDWDCQRKQPPEHIWIEETHYRFSFSNCKYNKSFRRKSIVKKIYINNALAGDVSYSFSLDGKGTKRSSAI